MPGGNHAQPVIDGMKRCTKCGRVLPIEMFNRHAMSPSGRRPHCRDCRTKDAREYIRRKRGDNYVDQRAKLLIGEDGRKLCTACGERKPTSEFYPDERMACGLETRCKQCNRERANNTKTNNLRSALRQLSHNCKRNGQTKRSKRRSEMDYTINDLDLFEIWHAQGGICPISGKRLTHIYGKKRVPTNASIDRIDNNKGYTRDNVRLVCLQVNHMRNELTDAELLEWCAAIISHASK